MLSQFERARLNLERAREMRASGATYRQIGRTLGLASGQLCHIRRVLKREKAAMTRLRSTRPEATNRDLPVGQSALPRALRTRLTEAGFRTLGDIADRLADPDQPRLETITGIGSHRAQLVRRLLEHLGLLEGPNDLQAAVEQIFPELR